MDLKFRGFSRADHDEVRAYMKALYTEDAEGQPMTDEKIDRTFAFLEKHNSSGNILVFEHAGRVVGYALIINYWSNEFGGNIVHLDEIYVDRVFRGKNIARSFIKHLIDSRYNDSVAMQIQVMPANEKAYTLYTNLGFKNDKNRFLFYQY